MSSWNIFEINVFRCKIPTVYVSCKFVTVYQIVIQLPNSSHRQCCFKRVLWKYLGHPWLVCLTKCLSKIAKLECLLNVPLMWCGISWHTLVTCVYIYTNVSTHTLIMQANACAYMAQAQTRDLRYISIWQSINTVIEYRIIMRCLMSIEMVICMFQKIAAHDLTFL